MRVALVANAHLRSRDLQGAGKIALDVAGALHGVGVLQTIYCYSADAEVQSSLGRCVGILRNPLLRKTQTAMYRAARFVQSLPVRRIEEQFFDSRVSRLIAGSGVDAVIFSKPVSPASVQAASRAGKLTAVLISTLHPDFNARVIEAARQRLGISDYSVFTDSARIARVTKVLRDVDVIVAESAYFRTNYVAYGVPAEKIALHPGSRPLGANLEIFRPPQRPPERFRFLHLSYMTLIKGIDVLLDAWRIASSEIDAELALVGTMDRTVSRLVRGRRPRGVAILGPTSRPAEQYQRASVFVSPSLSDAHPTTVFEAMACGVPCIVSKNCGASAFIQHGNTGWVYEHDDVAGLASLMIDAYRGRAALPRLGANARSYIEAFPLADFSRDAVETALARLSALRGSSMAAAAGGGARSAAAGAGPHGITPP